MRIFILAGLMAFSGALAYGADTSSSAQPNLRDEIASTKTACQPDIGKFCNGIKQGDGRIAACLKSHEDQLSSECKTSWTKTRADISNRMDKAEVAFRKNCGDDVQKFCSDVPSGKGRLLNCLDAHEDSLSSTCKSFQAKLDEKLNSTWG